MGISLAEIARHLGVGASAIAMAIRKKEHVKRIDDFDQRPPSHTLCGLCERRPFFPLVNPERRRTGQIANTSPSPSQNVNKSSLTPKPFINLS
jgi:hypothetical protein